MTRLASALTVYIYSPIAFFVNKDKSKDSLLVAFDTGRHCSTFVVLQLFDIFTAFVFFVSD